MADYYTNFSEVIEELSFEEIDWVRKNLKTYTQDEEHDEWIGGFQSILEGDRTLWIYSEGEGSPTAVCAFVQAFLQAFPKRPPFTMQWSLDCSRPSPGAYGGGAAVVTKDETKIMTTQQWIQDNLPEDKIRD
jgi:hypothetical protein